MSLLTWMTMDIIFFRKPSVIGAMNGMITGLVAITPAAGFVAGWGAIIIGGKSIHRPSTQTEDSKSSKLALVPFHGSA
jgi:ammonia channel protein AmtB